jgi:hypothetical protein
MDLIISIQSRKERPYELFLDPFEEKKQKERKEWERDLKWIEVTEKKIKRGYFKRRQKRVPIEGRDFIDFNKYYEWYYWASVMFPKSKETEVSIDLNRFMLIIDSIQIRSSRIPRSSKHPCFLIKPKKEKMRIEMNGEMVFLQNFIYQYCISQLELKKGRTRNRPIFQKCPNRKCIQPKHLFIKESLKEEEQVVVEEQLEIEEDVDSIFSDIVGSPPPSTTTTTLINYPVKDILDKNNYFIDNSNSKEKNQHAFETCQASSTENSLISFTVE